MSQKKGALAGYRVLDFSHLAAGPWSTMMLADMGAEIIKIEPPGKGEFARSAGGIYVGGESAVLLSLNRGKRSVALNLQTEPGRKLIRELIRTADVMVENFRPGTTGRLGISYEDAVALNPRIIYCSISAFGQTGPYREQPANDPIIQAISGTMALTATREGEPVRMGSPIPDFAAGMLAANAIVTALLHRERTGEGQKIELSLLDAQLFTLGPRAQEFFVTGEEPAALGSAHPSFHPYQAFRCRDGSAIYVACINDKFYQNYCRAIGREDLAADPRYRTTPDRLRHRDELDAILEPIMASRDRSEWLAALQAHEVPCGPVNRLREAFADPQVIYNQVTVEIDHPTAGRQRYLNAPVRYSKTPAVVDQPPPLLGEDTAEVLAELGYTAPDLAALRQQGVVG